ncbi:type IV pilus secretin PilQ family protein [Aestuariibacter halophilus]|uniref:Type IV pilus secretin PilQ family protein n=1 Tax=Fluctibacter halophilus TaxID=226011 RepID=A0ABS8GB19_9ALTE|nr:type IV pilus secretin PilQ family protein [Aestuariibacter halophilus]MCC2617381.1 type IV pilus secretin PilQ family protein [Aestuariibacter halophilus]
MSERFIFNKRLNRNNNRLWYVLALLIATVLSFKSLAQQDQPVLVDAEPMVQSAYSSTLNDLAFTRSTNDSAKVMLTFDNADYQMQISQREGLLIVHLPAVALGEEQLFSLDVSQFGAVVSHVETFEEDDGSAVHLRVEGPVTFEHQRNGEQLAVTVSERTVEEQTTESEFTGAPISLDFQDVPVRQVLQIIAQVNGFNLVTTDTVTGNVTISLSGVPWDQALNMILKIKGLDKRMEGNILLIAPAEELTARETQQLQSKQQVAELAPLVSANVQINYAKATEMAAILKSAEGSILSSRGSVTVDERTNTLLIRDTQSSVDEARAMIKVLDIPIKQVLIESRMVTVRDNVDEQLGVRWGFSDQQDSDGISGSLEGADAIAGGVIPTLDQRLNVNLPVNNPAGRIGIQVARLVDGTILDLELSALEAENKGEIIASPRITVANQREAYIEQGTEIPYVQATSSGATSVSFKKAVLSLKVTPHITPDNRIILDLVVTQDTRGETVSTSTGPAVAIDTQEISTQVLVENGETIVLGGIFQQTSADDVAKVPLLGDLPVVGNLFKNTQRVNEKRELLIFVTPKIMTNNL